jgi:hypothetical protein
MKKVLKKKNKPYTKGCRLQTFIGRVLYANVFELFMYDTRENMLSGIRRWTSENHYKDTPPDINIAGMVLEEDGDRKIIDEDNNECKVFAAMFLNEADFDIQTLSHECLHVTMVYERNILRFVGLYEGNDDTGEAAEERLAYTMGEYVDLILRQCIKHNIKIKYIEDDKKS